MNMTTSVARIAQKSLPALSGSQLTYNAERNLFLTTGYTSAAGNTYFRALRMSDRLAVYFEIGQGYAHTFLNGITLYCWDGTRAKTIAHRSYGGVCNWHCFSEHFAQEECVAMLTEYLRSQALLAGSFVSERDAADFSRLLVAETRQKQLR